MDIHQGFVPAPARRGPRGASKSGVWHPWEGPLPHEMLNPQFQGSFIRVAGQMAVAGALATGSTTSTGEVEVRSAKVYGPADLFLQIRCGVHRREALQLLHVLQGHRGEEGESATSLDLDLSSERTFVGLWRKT